MANLRRRMMMSQEDNEKLDYLTIIPDSVPATLYLGIPRYVYDDGEDYWSANKEIWISKDNGNTWEKHGGDDSYAEEAYININGPIKIKGNLNIEWVSEDGFLIPPRFNITNTTFTVEGSPMSLCYGDDFDSYTGEQTWSFYDMFNNSNIRRINNPKTFLPATSFRYSDDNIRSYPAYEGMFNSCRNLENSPEINLVNIGLRDCARMFYNCYNLTEAAAINSLTVGNHGCYYMYYGCVNLVKAQNVLSMDIKGYDCYGCMFRACSSLERAPELPALKLISRCYNEMFYGCEKLNYIKAMTESPFNSGYTTNWVYGVASTGTFVKNKNYRNPPTGVNGIPFGWTVVSE